jgi:hypothetical protein
MRLGKNANLYTQVDVPGTVDYLVDELREKYHRPTPDVPGAANYRSADVPEISRDMFADEFLAKAKRT